MGRTWLVQNALFGDEWGHEAFINAIRATGDRLIQLDYTFWDLTLDLKIDGIPAADMIPFGTREFVCYGRKNGWDISWDDDYSYPSLLKLGSEFVNHDMQVATLDELLVPSEGKTFIREASGFNIIKGQVISGYAWPEWVYGFKNGTDLKKSAHDWHRIDGDSLFVRASPKIIIDEYRVWIIGGHVTTLSQYVMNTDIQYSNADENHEVASYAQKIADLKPCATSNYVLDIFRTEGGLKVGEINCIHCSGWYAVDPRKIVHALMASVPASRSPESAYQTNASLPQVIR